MDIAVSLIGLLAAGAQVGSIITEIISTWRNAPALARKLDTEVNNFSYILSKVQQTVLDDRLLDRDRASRIDINHLSAALAGAVLTFSELELKLGPIKAAGGKLYQNRYKWVRAEKALAHLSFRLSKHEGSFTLIFTILTSESLVEIASCLENLKTEFISGAGTLAADVPELSVIGDSSSTHTVHSTLSSQSFRRLLPLSRPYKRAQLSDSRFSVNSSSSRKGQWSQITACSNDSVLRMPITLLEEAGTTLADGPVGSVRLPIPIDTLSNPERYLQLNPNIGVSTPKFALHMAAEKGRYEEVRQLLHRGIDVNMGNEQSRTALQLACANGHERTVQILLIHGADTDAINGENSTPLHKFAIAGELAVISALLLKGVNANAQDQHGETPTHYAARHGHVEIIEILVEHGANIDSKNNEGLTPLHRAVLSGDAHVVSLLLNHGAENGAADNFNQTPLHFAVTRGHKDIVGLLLKNGADIEAKQINGETPLLLAIEAEFEAIVSVLLAHRVAVNTTDSGGISPLMAAARKGCEAIAITLVERGADCNAKDSHGRTPLHYAASRGLEGLVRILHQGGADQNAVDDSGNTPRALASEKTIADLIESFPDRAMTYI